jgi:hypothetical protein
MKPVQIILFPAMFFFCCMLTGSCSAQPVKNTQTQEITDGQIVKVYYFHFTRRCVTCQAVEEQSRLAVESLYPEQIEEGRISFEGINIDEKSGEIVARETGVYGQALLIVCGEEKTDLTSEGFLYATNNPDKLKQILKENIDPLLFQ